MIAKCSCDHCGGNIEFVTEEFLSGSSITCPHCGRETILSVSPRKSPVSPPPKLPPPKSAIPLSSPAPSQTQKSSSGISRFRVKIFGGVFLALTVLFFIFSAALTNPSEAKNLDYQKISDLDRKVGQLQEKEKQAEEN
jgi:predicted RNA-binding Zn-ribbon protein involved in translation (DUF1610 family)